MKHTLILILSLLSICSFSQPQGINYQGVARDATGDALLNQIISLRLSILDSSATGQFVYVETQNATTNNTGLFNLSIGTGNVVSGVFANIQWGNGDKWLKIEMDAAGGSNYQLIGTSQFLSVPYAIYSGNGSLWDQQDSSISNTNSGNVGIGTIFPDASAQLDVSSPNKGFLPPRMTLLQRSAIPNPATGLIVWCSDCGSIGELQVYKGSYWFNLIDGLVSLNVTIGQPYLGGILAYILQPGDPGFEVDVPHGLIAAQYDQGTSEWGCDDTLITGADGSILGTGWQNTLDILAGCAEPNIAAELCSDLILNGYTDWYLPSTDELNKLYINRAIIGNFGGTNYWTSRDAGPFSAWYRSFSTGNPGVSNKEIIHSVRAIRSF